MTLVEMLNPFTGKKAGEAPDEQRSVGLEKDPLVQSVLAEFMPVRHKPAIMMGLSLPILSPAQINAVCSLVNARGPAPYSNNSYLIRSLVQSSYENGHDEFVLDFPYRRTGYVEEDEHMLAKMIGTAKRPMYITVHGAMGNYAFDEAEHIIATCEDGGGWFGSRTKHCNITLGSAFEVGHVAVDSVFFLQSATSVGRSARRCTFNVAGDASYSTGECAEDSTFDIKGTLDGQHCAMDAKRCTFILHGRVCKLSDWTVAVGYRATGCTFKVADEAAYQDLQTRIGKENTVLRTPEVQP